MCCFLYSQVRSIRVSVVFDFNASLTDAAPVSLMLLSVDLMRMKKEWFICGYHFVLFLLSLHCKSSLVSVGFDFSAPLNDVAPLSPILLAIDLMRMEKGELLMDAICVLFLLSLHCKLSSVSVVFDFKASLNDVAPLSPILFPVNLIRMEKSGLLMDSICVLFLSVNSRD